MIERQRDLRQPAFLDKQRLDDLVVHLVNLGFTVIGPVRLDGAVALRPIESASQLARGVRDEQDGGRYRIVDGDPDMYFDFALGPDGPKRQFFPPAQRLFAVHVEDGQFVLDAGPPQPPKVAFLGVRPCELAAIAIQDRAFGADDARTFRCESEAYYRDVRRNALLIAVSCTRPGGTCFCVSMETGPRATGGFDLELIELRAGFIISAGTVRGAEILAALPVREATPSELELAELKVARAREHMGRTVDTEGLHGRLERVIEHPCWDTVAERCLSCGNCTMVCPTCFCSTVTDQTEIGGPAIMRTRRWESCFTHEFSYTTAGPVRESIRGRYRHWLRHKLCTWWDQFGTSGCVGCGRCITWCPVGIDLTREVGLVVAGVPREGAAP